MFAVLCYVYERKCGLRFGGGGAVLLGKSSKSTAAAVSCRVRSPTAKQHVIGVIGKLFSP